MKTEFQPQFRFTGDIAEKMVERGIVGDQPERFVGDFDRYLAKAAKTETLIALGILAVKGTDGLGGGYNSEGTLLDIVVYWSLPRAKLYEPFSNMDKEVYRNILESVAVGTGGQEEISAAVSQDLSYEEYPSLEEFQTALEDSQKRKSFTNADSECEFWGLVTTEQLREELKAQTPSEI